MIDKKMDKLFKYLIGISFTLMMFSSGIVIGALFGSVNTAMWYIELEEVREKEIAENYILKSEVICQPTLCEQYADQELTSSRIAFGGGEKQYSINGLWVNESDLMESCKNG